MPRRRYSLLFPWIFLLADILFLNLSFALASYIKFGTFWFRADNYPVLLAILNIIWPIVFYFSELYKPQRDETFLKNINRVLTSIVINVSIIFTFWVATKSYYYSREHLFYTYMLFSGSIVAWRLVFHYSISHYRKNGFNQRNIVVVGYGKLGIQLREHFESNRGLGYKFLGFFDHVSREEGVVGKIDGIGAFVKDHHVDVIFCCLPKLYSDDIKNLVDIAENNLIKIKIISDFSTITNRSLSIEKFGNIPVINVSAIPLDKPINQLYKSTLDFLFAFVVILCLLSWLYPLLGLLIKMESKGPILFKQLRHGKNNKFFLCWKFRTMVQNDGEDDRQATRNDPRVTRVGQWMRRTSLDELPQFINVLRGEMSIVGPRPHPIKMNEQYSPQIDRFYQRHSVKPGITGLAQAKGYRGETVDFREIYGRIKLDRFYIKNWSLLLDLEIISMTIIGLFVNNEKAY
jgi:Undecaprenyl-phosphate glucose phosphotransferase